MLYPDTKAAIVDAVGRAFDSAGLTARQYSTIYNRDYSSCKICPSPPLASQAVLDNLPLNAVMGARTEVPLTEFCQTYEKFCQLSFYRRHDLSSLAFIKKGLALPKEVAEFYFKFDETEDVEKWHKQNYMRLLAFAQSAKVSFGGDTMMDTSTSFVVRCGEHTFGMYSGRPIVRDRVDPRAEYHRMIHPAGLSYAWKRTAYNLLPNMIDAAYAELLVTEIPDELKFSILQGLSMLRHGKGELEFKKLVVPRLPFVKVDFMTAKNLLEQAKQFEHFDDPVFELRSLLVPALISARRFRVLFGGRYVGVGSQMRYCIWTRWHKKLQELEEELLNAVETDQPTGKLP